MACRPKKDWGLFVFKNYCDVLSILIILPIHVPWLLEKQAWKTSFIPHASSNLLMGTVRLGSLEADLETQLGV